MMFPPSVKYTGLLVSQVGSECPHLRAQGRPNPRGRATMPAAALAQILVRPGLGRRRHLRVQVDGGVAEDDHLPLSRPRLRLRLRVVRTAAEGTLVRVRLGRGAGDPGVEINRSEGRRSRLCALMLRVPGTREAGRERAAAPQRHRHLRLLPPPPLLRRRARTRRRSIQRAEGGEAHRLERRRGPLLFLAPDHGGESVLEIGVDLRSGVVIVDVDRRGVRAGEEAALAPFRSPLLAAAVAELVATATPIRMGRSVSASFWGRRRAVIDGPVQYWEGRGELAN